MTTEAVGDAPLAPFFDAVPGEADYEIETIEGALPDYLRGTYYLNGPGRFRRGEARWKHWLDGDGMVTALTVGDGAARFRNRFVVSDKLAAEEEAGRPLYRAFGTVFPDDLLERGIGLESPVNVSVFRHAGRLLAFGEQGLPWELDPDTLETRGEWDFERALRPVSPFAAHPNFDPESGEMFNFGISFAPTRPKLYLYRFGADGELVYRRHLPLERPLSVHDFGLSARFAVFYLAPYVLDVERVTTGGASLLDALSWLPEVGTELRWIDRESGREAGRMELGDAYCLHLINAFDRGDELVVDVLEMDRPVYDQYDVPGLFPDARAAWPARYVVDPARGALLRRRTLGYEEMCDFPQVDPRRAGRPTDEFWMLGISDSNRPGAKFFDHLVHGDWASGTVRSWRCRRGLHLAGEPVVAPDPAGVGRGAVLCQELDPAGPSSAVLVFDARQVDSGPIARLELRHPVPASFHGIWVPAETVAARIL